MNCFFLESESAVMNWGRNSVMSLTAILVAVLVGPKAGGAAENKGILEYKKYEEVDLKQCYKKKFFGVSVGKCIDAGKFGYGSAGQVKILTFSHSETGEIGGILLSEERKTFKISGKTIEYGISCSANSAGSAKWSYSLGNSVSIPPTPAISVVDILSAVITRGMKAKSGAQAGQPATATKTGSTVSNGYAGAVTSSEWSKLMSAATAGCSFNPNPEVFSGTDAITIFKMAVDIEFSADEWKFNKSSGGGSAKIYMNMSPIVQVGNQKVGFKVVGKKVSWTLPGFTIAKDMQIISQPLAF